MAATILCALVCSLVFQLVWVPRVKGVLVEAEQREIERQVDMVINGLTPFLLSNQTAAVYETLDFIEDRYPDWLSIQLIRADQRRIYPLAPVEAAKGSDVVQVSRDIVLRGEVWGRLEASVDLAGPVAKLEAELMWLVLAAVAALVVAISALGYAVDRVITRRLAKLADAADRLGGGGYDAELPSPSPDEIGRLTSSFDMMRRHILDNVSNLEQARRQAEHALEVKSRFLATMSHELRTPLNGIIPVTELLRNTPLDAEQMKKVDTIQKSSHALLTIVNDILDLSRIEEDRLEIRKEPFSIRDLIHQVIDMLRAAAEEKGLHLTSEIGAIPAQVLGDEDRLRQILVNLVGNAIKFTQAGQVQIKCRPIVEASGEIKIMFQVTDTGIGIASADHARIFERFEQADSGLTRRYGGSGLGLAITKGLVRSHGGEIGLRSAPGEGSTFWFNLPFGVVRQPRRVETEVGSRAIETPAAVETPLDILVTDDNEINLEVAAAIIRKLGHRVSTAQNGAEAVEMVACSDFDLVFMDVHMPEMDGLEATRRIRNLGAPQAETPIIALTASVMEKDVRDCRAAGMDSVLPKPINANAVRDAIRTARQRNAGVQRAI